VQDRRRCAARWHSPTLSASNSRIFLAPPIGDRRCRPHDGSMRPDSFPAGPAPIRLCRGGAHAVVAMRSGKAASGSACAPPGAKASRVSTTVPVPGPADRLTPRRARKVVVALFRPRARPCAPGKVRRPSTIPEARPPRHVGPGEAEANMRGRIELRRRLSLPLPGILQAALAPVREVPRIRRGRRPGLPQGRRASREKSCETPSKERKARPRAGPS
jgi:hypothetical protein